MVLENSGFVAFWNSGLFIFGMSGRVVFVNRFCCSWPTLPDSGLWPWQPFGGFILPWSFANIGAGSFEKAGFFDDMTGGDSLLGFRLWSNLFCRNLMSNFPGGCMTRNEKAK